MDLHYPNSGYDVSSQYSPFPTTRDANDVTAFTDGRNCSSSGYSGSSPDINIENSYSLSPSTEKASSIGGYLTKNNGPYATNGKSTALDNSSAMFASAFSKIPTQQPAMNQVYSMMNGSFIPQNLSTGSKMYSTTEIPSYSTQSMYPPLQFNGFVAPNSTGSSIVNMHRHFNKHPTDYTYPKFEVDSSRSSFGLVFQSVHSYDKNSMISNTLLDQYQATVQASPSSQQTTISPLRDLLNNTSPILSQKLKDAKSSLVDISESSLSQLRNQDIKPFQGSKNFFESPTNITKDYNYKPDVSNKENTYFAFQPELGYLRSNGIFQLEFSKQPPENHRKTNFLSFNLKFNFENGGIIKSSKFEKFVDDGTPVENQNGIIYSVTWTSSYTSMPEHKAYIFLWLVDAESSELIFYQGKASNTKVDRVLVTHELDCQKCITNKGTCGTANEKPSNPVILSKQEIRVHVKCKQNCLRCSGNPKEIRRFRILIESGSEKSISSPRVELSRSIGIFVHNNSKRKRSEIVPTIKRIQPDNGTIGTNFVVVGSNFCSSCKIFLDDNELLTEMLLDTTLWTKIPVLGESGSKSVYVQCGEEKVCHETNFNYGLQGY